MSALHDVAVSRSDGNEVEALAKATRRRFSAEYKRKILREAEACTEPGAIGALLRREGLYSSNLTTWRDQRERGELLGLTPKKRGPAPKERGARDHAPRSAVRPSARDPSRPGSAGTPERSTSQPVKPLRAARRRPGVELPGKVLAPPAGLCLEETDPCPRPKHRGPGEGKSKHTPAIAVASSHTCIARSHPQLLEAPRNAEATRIPDIAKLSKLC